MDADANGKKQYGEACISATIEEFIIMQLWCAVLKAQQAAGGSEELFNAPPELAA